ncbi:serine/threonine protein kinase [Corallococcus coralloides DSM 2259]|uniref:Serine/threonine protein kinase n=1 Tax=Corallococcus coralloides (strain ATCC 25202 / DSM 2259 / NBRC 100086 / M2) TaxID=1144275 RepID=H8MSR5_CORCM|nr:serine/threonine-protein kinase [Corallococcus coralloides]AFE09892.1 serine/threonine protein kinase [Corallococcus coralloides DSM 2259]
MSIETYGSYQLLKRLATGGMAQIYLARRPGSDAPDKLLVLKRILPHLSENDEFVRMFLDEARIAARLAHPNVVQIYDLGAEGDTFFIAMEYIHGVDARRLWKRSETAGRPLPVPIVCRILLEACAGLDYAHKKTDAAGRPLGIVHRDVSPQNILVTFDGGVKVVDFGIAKAADQATVTRSGVLKGKYSYMSPEQAAGQRVDRRSDVFALGVVLHELLTGGRLFKRVSDMLTLSAVAECNVPVPSQVAPRVPVELDAIVLKALAKDPDARYQHAQELQRALEGWLASQPQPCGTPADLAGYMRELYSDRLTEEARSGEVQVTDEEAGVAPPSAPRRSVMRPATAPARTENEPTTTLRPNRPSRPSGKVEARREDAEADGARSEVRGPDTRPEGRNAEARMEARNSEGRGVDARPEPRSEVRNAEARSVDARAVDARPEPRSEVRNADPRAEASRGMTGSRRALESPPSRSTRPVRLEEPSLPTVTQDEDGPTLAMVDTQRKLSGGFQIEEDGPTLAMVDTEGKLSRGFQIEEDGPTLAMVDTQGKLSRGFQIEEDGPTLDQRSMTTLTQDDEDDSTLDMRAVSRADVDEGPTQDLRAVPRSEIPVPRPGGPTPSGEHRGHRLPVPAPHATIEEMTASTAPRSASRAPMPNAWVPPARTGTLTEQSAVERPKRRGLLYGAIVLVAILVGVGIVWSLGPGASGVHVESEPEGARVVFEDRVLPERTPLTLPTVKPGRYWVVLIKEGYRELRTQIVIPPSGRLDVGPLKLVPLPPSGKPGAEPPATAPPPPSTTPEPGVGPSGVAGPHAPDARAPEVKQAQESPGAQAPAPVVKAPVASAATVVPAAEVREAARAAERSAPVSFVVTPRAEVSCNGRKLGETPFQPVKLGVGLYDCKFTHPELKRTVSRRIEVRPIDLNVVTVKFE